MKHALFTWLVEHAADVLNRFVVGADGKTAVQRLKGKSCEKYVLEFGAAAMFRVCGKVEGSLMTERWFSVCVAWKKAGNRRACSHERGWQCSEGQNSSINGEGHDDERL